MPVSIYLSSLFSSSISAPACLSPHLPLQFVLLSCSSTCLSPPLSPIPSPLRPSRLFLRYAPGSPGYIRDLRTDGRTGIEECVFLRSLYLPPSSVPSQLFCSSLHLSLSSSRACLYLPLFAVLFLSPPLSLPCLSLSIPSSSPISALPLSSPVCDRSIYAPDTYGTCKRTDIYAPRS